jgi:hypothetical protein
MPGSVILERLPGDDLPYAEHDRAKIQTGLTTGTTQAGYAVTGEILEERVSDGTNSINSGFHSTM